MSAKIIVVKKIFYGAICSLLVLGFALSAQADNIQITTLVDTSGSTYNASLIIEPEAVLADGQSQAVVLIFMRNAQNEPVANKTISLTTSRPDKDDIEETHPTTGVDGVAYFKLKSQFEGDTIVTASLGETKVGEGQLNFFKKSRVFFLTNSPLMAAAGFFVIFELLRFIWLLFFKKRQHQKQKEWVQKY